MTLAMSDTDRTMPREALRALSPAILAQFQFPEDVSGADADKTLERRPIAPSASVPAHAVAPLPVPSTDALVTTPRVSVPPIAVAEPAPRARPNPNATQEVDAGDVLEVASVDYPSASIPPIALSVAPPAAAPAPRAPLPLTPRVPAPVVDNVLAASEVTAPGLPREPRHAQLSFPVDALDMERGNAPRRDFGWVLGGLLVGSAIILVAAIAGGRTSGTHARVVGRAPAAIVRDLGPAQPFTSAAPSTPGSSLAAATSTKEVSAEASNGVPLVSVLSLPRVIPTTGTIRLGESVASHRLFVDGAVQTGTSAEVRCGQHTVKIGSRGRAHALNVACGEEVVVTR